MFVERDCKVLNRRLRRPEAPQGRFLPRLADGHLSHRVLFRRMRRNGVGRADSRKKAAPCHAPTMYRIAATFFAPCVTVGLSVISAGFDKDHLCED
jgi:hypothetical protein